ncbi:MAG: sulfite exporter TauE/SafE family protein [Limisphaerales bacterium]
MIYSAFILGFAGSLHCAAMCGPLVMAIPAGDRGALGRVIYNAGRLTTYALLGALFGFVGWTLIFAGLQCALSIMAGMAVLLGVALSTRAAWNTRFASVFLPLKRAFSRLVRHRNIGGRFLLGGLNGLLPCGLVYVAAALAAASGGPVRGTEVMLAFGLGTVPMMLGIGFVQSLPKVAARLQWHRVLNYCSVLAGVMLILRGLALGIPYISPNLLSHAGPLCCGH